MIKVNLDKVQAEFIAQYEDKKIKLDEAKSAAAEKARLAVVESEEYKAELERHAKELEIIAEKYIAEETANDKAVVSLTAAIEVYADFTEEIVEEIAAGEV